MVQWLGEGWWLAYLAIGAFAGFAAGLLGIGGGAVDWSPIMPALAQHHRVCAFDRLGQDWSDPAPHPRDFGTAARAAALELADPEVHRERLVDLVGAVRRTGPPARRRKS